MKKIWILAVFGLFSLRTAAQIYIANCTERLREAREMAGRSAFDAIENLLQPCLNNREFSEEEEKEAAALLKLAQEQRGDEKERAGAVILPAPNRPFLQFENIFAQSAAGFQSLQDARTLYDKGRLDEVPAVLHKILKTQGLNKEKKSEILTLLTETYLFLRHTDSAKLAYLQLWRTDPAFRPSFQAYTPDFVFFTWRFKSFPSIWVAAKGGVNSGFVELKKSYSPAGVEPAYARYSDYRTTQLGASLTWHPASPKIGIGLDFLFSSAVDYQYNTAFSINLPDVEATDGTLLFYEEQKILQLPVYAKWNWGKYDYYDPPEEGTEDFRRKFWRNLTPFFVFGFTFQYMSDANFTDIQRSWRKGDIALPFTGSSDLKQLSLFGLDGVEPLRRRYNLGAMAGIGINYRLSYKFAIFAEATYTRNLFAWVNEDNRQTDKTINDYTFLQQFYLDDDLIFHNVAARVGLEFPLWYKIIY